MAVIPMSHMALSRSRRDLSNALSGEDWEAVCELDKQLIQALDVASEDSQRDSVALLGEVEQVLRVYRDLVKGCQKQVSDLAL